MALEEQSFRYTRLKKEAKELRAGLRLKNITIDKLQQTIQEINKTRPKKNFQDPLEYEYYRASFETMTDSKNTSNVGTTIRGDPSATNNSGNLKSDIGENNNSPTESIPTDKMSVLVTMPNGSEVHTNVQHNSSIQNNTNAIKSKNSSDFQSLYYTQQEVDDLEQIGYQYQSTLDENFNLKEKLKFFEQELQKTKIQLITSFNSNSRVEELTKELELAKSTIEKNQFLFEQQIIEKNQEIQEVENKYFEFEMRLFEGVGHGLKVKDEALKIKRLREWSGKVDFALDRRILQMNQVLQKLTVEIMESDRKEDTAAQEYIELVSDTGEGIDGSSETEITGKRNIGQGVNNKLGKQHIHQNQHYDMVHRTNGCRRGFCAFNGETFGNEEKRALETQNMELAETLDSIEHTSVVHIKQQFEMMLQQERQEYVQQLDELRTNNLFLNRQMLSYEYREDRTMLLEAQNRDLVYTIKEKDETLQTLNKQVLAKENEMQVMMNMVLQTNELLEKNQAREIQKSGEMQAYAVDDGSGGFRIAKNAGRG